MSFMAYELVSNPDIQQKLYEEVQEMNNELNGNKISYEQIQSLKYLDQVVSETLRKWPAAPVKIQIIFKSFFYSIGFSSGYRSSLRQRLRSED